MFTFSVATLQIISSAQKNYRNMLTLMYLKADLKPVVWPLITFHKKTNKQKKNLPLVNFM